MEFIMKTEYELRLLNINILELVKKVENLGARRVGKFHQIRYVYDFIPPQKGKWIRLRSNGEKTTLTVKEIHSANIDGTKELEVEVADITTTYEILKKLGYIPRTFQENFRIEFVLDDIIFDFDIWPMIPPYLEIEGKNESSIITVIKKLGLSLENFSSDDVDSIYKKEYNIDLAQIKNLKFSIEEQKIINDVESEIK